MSREAETALRREAVVRAAVAVAREEGWAAISVRKVAGRAEIAVGSVRHLFPGQSQLLRAAASAAVEPVLEALGEAVSIVEMQNNPEGVAYHLHALLSDERVAASSVVWADASAARQHPQLMSRIDVALRELAHAVSARMHARLGQRESWLPHQADALELLFVATLRGMLFSQAVDSQVNSEREATLRMLVRFTLR